MKTIAKRVVSLLCAAVMLIGTVLTSSEAIRATDIATESLGTLTGRINADNLDYSKIKALLYSGENYIEDDKGTGEREDDANHAIQEVFLNEDGEFTFDAIVQGNYRLNFVSEDSSFDARNYELINEVEGQAAPEVNEKGLTIDGIVEDNTNGPEVFYANDEPFFAYALVYLNYYSAVNLELREVAPVTEETIKPTEEVPVKEELVETPEAIEEEGNKDEETTEENANEVISSEEEKVEDSKNDVSEIAVEGIIEESKETSEVVEKEKLPIYENDPIDTTDLMSIKDLSKLDEATVGATVQNANLLSRAYRMISGSQWSFDAYYVGEDDKYYTEKDKDFSLKYQMEFHASRDLAANTVEIRVPLEDFKNRAGEIIAPTEFAIPMGTVAKPVASKQSPFNYYIEGTEIVFFNYKAISSGSNSAWQVQYKNLKAMDITDGTEWKIEPTISVTVAGNKETQVADAMTGRLDTEVNLTGVSKKAFDEIGKSYTPGLYSKAQVEKYISGSLPSKYANSFEDYVYVVWEVGVRGNATQPWNLLFKETPNQSGEVVGYKGISPTASIDSDYADYQTISEFSKGSSLSTSFYVVTAYPAADAVGKTFENTVDVVLQPYDELDEDQSLSADAKWKYKEYDWYYSGDVTSIDKTTPRTPLKGWMSVYEERAKDGKDFGALTYNTTSKTRAYGQTHNVTGSGLGELKNNAYVETTTTDDILYAHSSKDTTLRMLDSSDYYFSGVSISASELGFDVWEDSATGATSGYPATIYVMNEGSTSWTELKTIEWSAKGFTYKFSETDLASKPYRVKVVQKSNNYELTHKINVDVTLRSGSPVLSALLTEKPTSINIQNLSGIYGTVSVNGTETLLHDENDENYDKYPNELKTFSQSLHDGATPQRDNAAVDITELNESSSASKSAKVSNDIANGRVNVTYTLSAYDGYEFYSEDGYKALREYRDLKSPGRDEVMFYDLLPYGVQFDPSAPISGGILNNGYEDSQVELTVDKVTSDYKGTGRTMVAFKLTYSGADSAYFDKNSQMWKESWGVTFGAYYEWKDADVVDKVLNVVAFMPAKDDNRALLGSAVYKDDGTIPSNDYKDFGADIDGDGNTEESTVLYARSGAHENILLASESKIEKLVRADDDKFASFDKQATVGVGQGYTYDVSLHNAEGSIKNVVIFDRVENAGKDRAGIEDGIESTWWNGTFNGLQLRALDELGIDYKVYYNANRDAVLPEMNALPSSVLTTANEWYEASAYSGELSTVKAFAVDISKKTDGTDFTLESLKGVSFQVKMIAPSTVPTATYAYNNPSYYRYSTTSSEGHTVIGNTVKVQVGELESLEVIKRISDTTPEVVKDSKFEFTALRGTNPMRNTAFELWEEVDGNWKQISATKATDADGHFYLKANQKALFASIPAADGVTIEETKNPFWNAVSEREDNVITFTNTYRPVLYAQKELKGVPEGVDTSGDAFTFQLLAGDVPVANAEFYYVNEARTDGGYPLILGEGTTDGFGKFTIHAGETIALFPGDAGTIYTLKEVSLDSNRWFTDKAEVSGLVSIKGVTAKITNHYKVKDLLLTKELKNQKASACTEDFTFKVTDADGNPMAGHEWVLVDKAGVESTEASDKGTLNASGEFTYPLAGKTVKIKGLEAGKTYVVTETNYGSLYEPENDGIAEVTMQKYAFTTSAKITNDYLMRSLKISKHVLYDVTDETVTETLKTKTFEFLVTINGVPAANKECKISQSGMASITGTTDGNGKILLTHGQTATFTEIARKGDKVKVVETADTDFPQVYPTEGGAFEETFGSGTPTGLFVNGAKGTLLLQKDYVGADSIGDDMISAMKSDASLRSKNSVSFTLEVTENGSTYTYPKADTQVVVLDILTGKTENVTWTAGSALKLAPWKTVVVSGLSEDASYKLKESKEDSKHVTEYDSGYVQVKQVDPVSGPVSGTVTEKPVAIITNQIEGIKKDGSLISKEMRIFSNDVPEGAVLIWKVEEYDGEKWSVKEDVSYLTLDDKGVTCKDVQKTGSDGYIKLVKTANGYPKVQFTEDIVKLNLISGMSKGDLRVTEVLAESDEEWGCLSGYNGSEIGLNVTDGNGFINSNTRSVLEVEKQMEEGMTSDDIFTFVLEQVTSTNNAVVSTKDDILESTPQGGVKYTVYDSETDLEISTKETTANGEMYLKAGQYLKVVLYDGTYWTITERVVSPYKLAEVKVNGDIMSNLDGVALVNPQTVNVEGILLTQAMVDSGVIDAQTGQPVDLKNGHVVIPEFILVDDEIKQIVGTADSSYTSGAAFYNAQGTITGVTFPKSFKTIGEWSFYNCNKMTGDLIISDSVTSIGKHAFYKCSGFTGSLTIPDSVTSIGDSAFRDCSGFTGSLTIPDSVTSVNNSTFSGCRGLTGSLTIPNSVTSIGSDAFNGCTGFKGNLTIDNSVTTIGNYAFYSCSGFTGDLKIPDSVTTIGNYAFYYCYGFKDNLTIGDSVTSIGERAFYQCRGFTGSLKIPDSVTMIGSYAFNGCTGFTDSLTIGDGVTSIGDYAFVGCSGFTGDLTIPNSVTGIGNNAFNGCRGFTGSLTIGDSVTSIGNYAFRGCNGFKGDLTIGNSVTTIGGHAFAGCSGFTGDLKIPNSVTSIGDYAFYGCSGFTGDLKIPDSVTSIGDMAFRGCNGFKGNLTIGNGVTSIGEDAFFGCSGFMGDLTIPDSVETIGVGAFYECLGYTGNLTIGNGVTSIGNWAFYGCKGFTGDLTIPDSVEIIGSGAFSGCGGRFFVTTNQRFSVFDGVLYDKNITTAIAALRGNDTNNLTIPDSVTTIGDYAFSDCDGFTGSLTISNGVEIIGDYAFYDCYGFKGNLTIGDSVTTIGDYAFSDCDGFTGNLTIPDSVTTIGDYAFSSCSRFTGSLTIGNSVKTIGNYAFEYCYGFEGNLTIGDSVETIYGYAFYYCSRLTSVTIGKGITSLHSPFKNCISLTSITINRKEDAINGAPWGADSSVTVNWIGTE
ncbi:hypothetical protein M2146_001154 [Lachnospiraceae bacterium PF1-22]